jgi:hypothetical protein
MPIVVKKGKGTYGIQRVAYRHIDGNTYAAAVTGSAALGTPSGVVVTPQGTTGAATYGYRVTALGGGGETLAATEGTTATGNATLTGANFNRVTWNALTGASGYAIYRTTGGATQGKIGTSTTATFDDTGLAAAGAVPGGNTAVSFNIHIPSLKPAGAAAANKTGIAFLSSRTATGGIVVGR